MAAIPHETRATTMIARAQIHQQVTYSVAASENGKAILLAAAWVLMGIWLDEDRVDTAKIDMAHNLVKAVNDVRGRYQ